MFARSDQAITATCSENWVQAVENFSKWKISFVYGGKKCYESFIFFILNLILYKVLNGLYQAPIE